MLRKAESGTCVSPRDRAGERVAARERVVHADVVETTPDGDARDSQYVISEQRSYCSRRSRPPRNDSSITKLTPTTVPPSCFDEAGDRLHRSAGREHVVVDDDPRAAGDRVGCDLERVLAVLERVASRRPSPAGACPAAAPATKPQPASTRDRRAEPEAARLGAEHEVRPRARASTRRARPTACRSASGSSSSGEMSLKPTPGSGKSGTSRTRVVRSIRRHPARLLTSGGRSAATAGRRAPARSARARCRSPSAGLPALGVARPQRRADHRLEQARSRGRRPCGRRAGSAAAIPKRASASHAAAMSASLSA